MKPRRRAAPLVIIQRPFRRKSLYIFAFYLFMAVGPGLSGAEGDAPRFRVGMTKSELASLYSKENERTYRTEDAEEWATFEETSGKKIQLITFHLRDGRVMEWKWDDRAEVVREYMGEFCSEALLKSPKIRAAIRDVLMRMPRQAFYFLTRRDFPALFTEYYTEGPSRLANSSGILGMPEDPPTFTRGIWIVKINAGLETPATQGAIEGIVAHELAHRILGHRPGQKDALRAEKTANRLVRRWGLQKEFLEAKDLTASL